MRILVTGPREWTDREAAEYCLRLVAQPVNDPGEITLVHGAARGFDRICASLAERMDWKTDPHPADWFPGNHLDKLAGHRRNQAMVDLGADIALAGIMPCLLEACKAVRPHPTHGTMDCIGRVLLAGISLIPVKPGIKSLRPGIIYHVPQVIPAHIALRSQLKDSVQHAIVLNERLELLVAVKTTAPSERFHGKVDHSQPPWNAQIANAVLDLHQLARVMETWLRRSQSLTARPRGGSDGNTRKALEAVVRLSEAADDGTVKEYTRDLEQWIKTARIALGETEAPKRLPRLPGAKEPQCPFCQQRNTLRMRPLEGKISCINPDCKDENDRKPSARMEYSGHVGDFVLVWQDGIAGVPIS